MSENIARNMYSSQGIINYPTQLHLVGHFHVLYHNARKHEYQLGIHSSNDYQCEHSICLILYRTVWCGVVWCGVAVSAFRFFGFYC